jgi:ABC-type transport system substrate-binding protein
VLYPVTKKPDGLQDLIKQLLTTSDYNTQKTMSKQAVKILQDDCTAMPVYISSACYVLQKNVHDTGFNQLGGAGFRWSVQKAWMSK